MPVAEIVNQWFRERLACGALARDTEAYNQAFSAIPDLVARLGGAGPEAADSPRDSKTPPAAAAAPSSNKE